MEQLNRRSLDEGDLFGIRALEKGFFGGVAQSETGSAAPSLFSIEKDSKDSKDTYFDRRSVIPQGAPGQTVNKHLILDQKRPGVKKSVSGGKCNDCQTRLYPGQPAVSSPMAKTGPLSYTSDDTESRGSIPRISPLSHRPNQIGDVATTHVQERLTGLKKGITEITTQNPNHTASIPHDIAIPRKSEETPRLAPNLFRPPMPTRSLSDRGQSAPAKSEPESLAIAKYQSSSEEEDDYEQHSPYNQDTYNPFEDDADNVEIEEIDLHVEDTYSNAPKISLLAATPPYSGTNFSRISTMSCVSPRTTYVPPQPTDISERTEGLAGGPGGSHDLGRLYHLYEQSQTQNTQHMYDPVRDGSMEQEQTLPRVPKLGNQRYQAGAGLEPVRSGKPF
jgi:hypothetical protein